MSGQVNVKNLTGLKGGIVIKPGSTVTGKWNAIQFVEDSMINVIQTNIDQSTSNLNNQAVPGGLVLFGVTTSLSLGSGTAVAYDL